MPPYLRIWAPRFSSLPSDKSIVRVNLKGLLTIPIISNGKSEKGEANARDGKVWPLRVPLPRMVDRSDIQDWAFTYLDFCDLQTYMIGMRNCVQ